MKTWRIKDFATLTGVSRRTLHHYDHIGLLKPSIRQANNYRFYSEQDLGRLQQILALKFFGFELKHIARLIDQGNQDSIQNLVIQQKLLDQEISRLNHASECLATLIDEAKRQKSIDWKMTVKLIEVFEMSEQLKASWLSKVFTQDELKDYAELKISREQQENLVIHQEWVDILSAVEDNLDEDPSSPIGAKLAKRCMDWVHAAFKGKRALGTKIWHGYVEGVHDNEISQESIHWLRQALDAYYTQKCHAIIARATSLSPQSSQGQTLLQEWQSLMDEMFGDDQDGIETLYQELDANFVVWLDNAEKK